MIKFTQTLTYICNACGREEKIDIKYLEGEVVQRITASPENWNSVIINGEYYDYCPEHNFEITFGNGTRADVGVFKPDSQVKLES